MRKLPRNRLDASLTNALAAISSTALRPRTCTTPRRLSSSPYYTVIVCFLSIDNYSWKRRPIFCLLNASISETDAMQRERRDNWLPGLSASDVINAFIYLSCAPMIIMSATVAAYYTITCYQWLFLPPPITNLQWCSCRQVGSLFPVRTKIRLWMELAVVLIRGWFIDMGCDVIRFVNVCFPSSSSWRWIGHRVSEGNSSSSSRSA